MALTRVSGNLITSTAVTAGVYGGSGNTINLTVDAQGRITAAANVVSSGGGITYTTVKTANYTAVADDGVQTNTTAGAFTVTLPATPSNGDQVFVVDSFNTWGTNNLTIGRNGSTIEGVAQDLVCDITGVSVQCVYNGTTWDIYAQVGGAGGSFLTTPSFTSTIGVGNATASASGAGITFPATQSASSDANTLDDYEEGTWSPSIGGSTTYSYQDGYYTKCGNVVTVTGRMQINLLSGNANTYQITNLPFTSKNTSNGSKAGGGSVGYWSSTAINVISLQTYVETNTTTLVFQYSASASSSALTATIFGNSTDVYFTATYLT